MDALSKTALSTFSVLRSKLPPNATAAASTVLKQIKPSLFATIGVFLYVVFHIYSLYMYRPVFSATLNRQHSAFQIMYTFVSTLFVVELVVHMLFPLLPKDMQALYQLVFVQLFSITACIMALMYIQLYRTSLSKVSKITIASPDLYNIQIGKEVAADPHFDHLRRFYAQYAGSRVRTRQTTITTTMTITITITAVTTINASYQMNPRYNARRIHPFLPNFSS
jgi:hypothetical protein